MRTRVICSVRQKNVPSFYGEVQKSIRSQHDVVLDFLIELNENTSLNLNHQGACYRFKLSNSNFPFSKAIIFNNLPLILGVIVSLLYCFLFLFIPFLDGLKCIKLQ
ncbi:uncharacterized protein LOC119662280 [Teleopsis dalmanni]|uniref:uncharacterized protein LOC119662280 n=1 Tax=Teleopsis dalmanni TaxID=139649 RepID=UPI0018CE41C3|nr:uncharacterized protein LOC119662280 [Teleopsis dalmanni]